MKVNCTFYKSLVVSVSLIISLVTVNKAQALYIFDWLDSSQESYTLPGDRQPTIVPADKWEGFFTLPDSAVTYWFDFGNNVEYRDLDTRQYLDFSLTGKLASGNYMEATAFHGASVLHVPEPIGTEHKFVGFYLYTGPSPLSFVMADPSWLTTPLYLTSIDEDSGAISYMDTVFDPKTNSMVPVYVTHDGVFASRYVADGADSAPVPEPATMILLGCGLAGIIGTRLRKKK